MMNPEYSKAVYYSKFLAILSVVAAHVTEVSDTSVWAYSLRKEILKKAVLIE